MDANCEHKFPSRFETDKKPKLCRRNPFKEVVSKDQNNEVKKENIMDEKSKNCNFDIAECDKSKNVFTHSNEFVGLDKAIKDSNVQSSNKSQQDDDDKKNSENLQVVAPRSAPEIPGISFIIGIKPDDEVTSKKLLYHCVICHEDDDTVTFVGSAMKKHSHSRTHLLNVMRAECYAMYEKFVDDHQTPEMIFLKRLIEFESKLLPQKIIIVRRKNYCSHREKVISKIKELHYKAKPIIMNLELQEPENNRKVYVGRISCNTRESTVQEYFEKFGEVNKLDIKRNPGTTFNYGFVVFSCAAVVDEVLQHSPHCLDGNTLNIERYGEKFKVHKNVDQYPAVMNKEEEVHKENHLNTIYVGPLDYRIKEEGVRAYLEKFGEIVNVHFNKSKKDHSLDKLFGFITYTKPFMVDKVLHHGLHKINGIPMRIVRYSPKYKTQIIDPETGHTIIERKDLSSDAAGHDLQEEKNVKTLYVGPFDKSVNTERLKSYLCQYGNIIRTYFKQSKHNIDKLFGFITFANASMAENVLRSGPHKIDGIPVNMERDLKETVFNESSDASNNRLQRSKEEDKVSSSDLRLILRGGEICQNLEKKKECKVPLLPLPEAFKTESFMLSVDKIKEYYQNNLFEIMELQKGRMQMNLVIVTDERDNFDVTLTGHPRVSVMRIPGLKFVNAYASISRHSLFGQGSLFVYSGGTHDFVLSVPLQDCVKSRCPSLKTMLTIGPCVRDYRYLIGKALELNMQILSSTPNDMILFSGVLPVLLNKFNMASLKGRNCALHHQVWPIPNVYVDDYMQAVRSFNEFIKFHSQALGYPTWNLTTLCDNDANQNTLNLLLPDGYNISPEEEFKRANLAKNICTDLLRISASKYVKDNNSQERPLKGLNKQEEPLTEFSIQKGLLKDPSNKKEPLKELYSQKDLSKRLDKQEGNLKGCNIQEEPLEGLNSQQVSLKGLSSQEAPLKRLSSPVTPLNRLGSQEAPLKGLSSQVTPLNRLGSQEAHLKGLSSQVTPLNRIGSQEAPLKRLSSQVTPLNRIGSQEAPLKGLDSQVTTLNRLDSQEAPLKGHSSQVTPLNRHGSQETPLRGLNSQVTPLNRIGSQEAPLRGLNSQVTPLNRLGSQEAPLRGLSSQEVTLSRRSSPNAPLNRFSSREALLKIPSGQKELLHVRNEQERLKGCSSQERPLIEHSGKKISLKRLGDQEPLKGLYSKNEIVKELSSQKGHLEVGSRQAPLDGHNKQGLPKRLDRQGILEGLRSQKELIKDLSYQKGHVGEFSRPKGLLESVHSAHKWQKETITTKKEPASVPSLNSEIQTSTKPATEKSEKNLPDRIKLLYDNDMKEIVQMLKNRKQNHIVIITDDRENLDMNLSGFSSQVDILKIPDLKYDNAFPSIKQHPRFGQGTIFVLSCGSLDVLLSIPQQDCLEFKCDRPLMMLTVSPCASDIHYLIRKALEVNMNILHSTQNDIALFCRLTPVDIKDHNLKMLGNRPCFSNHPASSVPAIGFTSFINYNDTIECYNSFIKYHSHSLGFSIWDLEGSLSPKKNTEGSPHLNRYKICPDDDVKRLEKVKMLCGELIRAMPSSSEQSASEEGPCKENLIKKESGMNHQRGDKQCHEEFANIKMEKSHPPRPEMKQQTCDNELLEKVKSLYKNNLVKIIKMRKNRSPTKICLVTDERENFDTSLAGFDRRVEVLIIPEMKFGTVWSSSLKSHPSYGKGTNFVFCGGNHDLVYSVSLPDCLGNNCQSPQSLMTFRPCIKDTHYLIKKSLQLHMNVLLDTRNDTVSFCGLIPISVNQYNYHTTSIRPCLAKHPVKEIPAVDAMSVCNYNDVVDWFNAFTKYHSEMLNYPHWNLEIRHFDKNGCGNTLSTNLYGYSKNEETERTNQVRILCKESLPKLPSSEQTVCTTSIPSTQPKANASPSKATSGAIKNVGQLQPLVKLSKEPARPIVASASNIREKKDLKRSNNQLGTSKSQSIEVRTKSAPIAVDKQQSKENEVSQGDALKAPAKLDDNKCPPKYTKKYLERVSDRYIASVQKIVEMHKGRTQNSVVIVTDERDNFDVCFVGFSKRVEILKIPGMQFKSVFDILKEHPYFGKGTIFVFSGGTHDVLVPIALQDCIEHRCTRPQAVMTLPPYSSDPHFLVEKVLKLNLDILRSTKNDVALFAGLLPVLINQYNNFYLTTRPCFLDHPAWQLPNASSTLDNNYKCLLSWYNDFTKLHAQSLGFEPWDLEAPYIEKVAEVLLANGYNLAPTEEFSKNKQAKSLCDGLLLNLNEVETNKIEHRATLAPSSQTTTSSTDYTAASPTKDSIVSNTQVAKTPPKSIPDKKVPNTPTTDAINKIIDIKVDAVRTRTDEELDEVITFSKNILNAADVEDEATNVAFENVFFVGKRDNISPLFGCNLKSRMIYHELTTFEDSDMMTLLSKIGDFPEKSVCCLAFDLTIITKKLVVSPTCLEQSCQQPLFVTALRTSSTNSIQAMREINQFIYNHLLSISKFITKLSQLCIPIIILPLAPERIYCDEGVPQKHQLSHEFSNLGSCVVVSGTKDLWTEATLALNQCWNNLMETHNGNFDPSKYIVNYIQNNPSTFIVLEDLNDYVTHWKAPRFWKAFVELYLSSVIKQRQNESEDAADLFDKICDGVLVSKVSPSIPSDFFEELFKSIDRDVHILKSRDHFMLKGMSLRRAYLLRKLNHFRLGDMILLITIVNEPANVHLEMNLMENLYISCIFERVYRKWKAQIITNLTNLINQVPNVATYKSKVCEEGFRCNELKRCLRYHSHHDQRRNPFLRTYSITMCTMAKSTEGLCREGLQCRNAHNVYEARFHPSIYQSKICPSGLSSEACNRLKRCEFAHKDSPEMFFTAEWKDLVAVGANQALRFFSGAIRGIPKVQDLSRLNMRVLFISPSSEFLDVALRATEDLIKTFGLSTCMLGKDIDDLGSSQILLGAPSSFMKLDTRVFIQMRGSVIIDDIQRIMENELLRNDLSKLLNLITASSYNVVLNKVFISAGYDPKLASDISELAGLQPKQLHVLAEDENSERGLSLSNVPRTSPKRNIPQQRLDRRSKSRSLSRSRLRSESRNKDEISSRRSQSTSNSKRTRSKSRSGSKRPRSRSRSSRSRSRSLRRSKRSRSRSRSRFPKHSRYDGRIRSKNRSRSRSRSVKRKRRSRSISRNTGKSLSRSSDKNYGSRSINQRRSLHSGFQDKGRKSGSQSPGKSSRSKKSSPTKKPKTADQTFNEKELPCPNMEVQNDLRKRIGAKQFEEYLLTLDTLRHDFTEEYLVYRDMPELYPGYAHHYDIFTALFTAQHGEGDEQRKELLWKVFWKSKYETIRLEDWSMKLSNLTEEFEKRVARNSPSLDENSSFSFEEALTLLDGLCDEKIFFLAPGLRSLIKMCRERGTTSKEAFDLFTEADNVALLNIALEKFKTLSHSSVPDDSRRMYERVVEWIPMLLAEAERGPSYHETRKEGSTIDLESIARFSLGKAPEVTLNLIKTALAYEGTSNPPIEVINELFLKVCKIHFTLSMDE